MESGLARASELKGEAKGELDKCGGRGQRWAGREYGCV